MTARVHSFNAGPAAMPLPVLEQAQRDLVDYQGAGMSVLEMSHRGGVYERIHQEAIDDLAALLGTGDSHQILFMGGGARAQFAFVPMNLLPAGRFAEYVVTGSWAEIAWAEAKRLGDARENWTSAGSGHDHVPSGGIVRATEGSAYLHVTSNNTIYGTQFVTEPTLERGATSGVPLVVDMSSDILSRPIDTARYSLIYAGAQKNLGPAGVTVIVIRKDLLENCRADLPEIFQYKKIAAQNSLLNTPPCFAIYMVGLVAKHVREMGGVEAAARRNEEKAALIYDAINSSGGFYQGHAQPESRSRMNVTFRLPNEELEKAFLKEAAAASMEGLKGHRSVGGLRASIYNAVPLESVRALVGLMAEFRARRA